ncbi:MAG: helix-hairpin-helix domain-containing protein [candidate division KSB1 bacterium]|nr:helix-hairpin-helix domain-containing protein [candidate division KSB1 bacterium]
MMKISYILILVITGNVIGQTADIEHLIGDIEEAEQNPAYIEYLYDILENPLNINKASKQELETLPGLSPAMAARILYYRNRRGRIHHLDELESLPGMDKKYEKIKPFIAVPKHRPTHISIQGRHRIQRKLALEKAYKEHSYAGDPNKVYSRLRGEVNDHIAFGVITEKDAGEKKWNDHTSAHISIKFDPLNTKLVLGDYSFKSGYGLVFGGAFRVFKGATPKRHGNLKEYMSSNETAYFRGIGIESRFSLLSISVFKSQKFIDGEIIDSTISILPSTGYHRTQTECKRRRKIKEKVWGGRISINPIRSLEMGLTYQHHTLPQQKLNDDLVDIFKVPRKINHVTGLYLDFSINNTTSFAEIARSKSKGTAFYGGVSCNSSIAETVITLRYYEPGFDNDFSNAFAEYSETRNEKGVYWGCRVDVSDHTELYAYIDAYQEIWPSAATRLLRKGAEFMVKCEQEMSNHIDLQLRYKRIQNYEFMSIPDKFGNTVKEAFWHLNHRARVQIELDRSPFRLRTRFESHWNQLQNHTSQNAPVADSISTLIYQDIRLKCTRTLSLYTRWTAFDAPVYPLRLYQFENGLPGTMSIKMLNGRGTRWYLLFVYKLPHAADFLQIQPYPLR